MASGALLENVKTGDDIDLFKIPVPRWHEHDGGYYIGTGDMVIMRDPDTGWINYGAYRVQAHDKKLATVMCSKGKHGDMIQKKYHERGQPCPVAVVCGMHPALFMIAGLEIPHGKNEYDAAGGLLGEPVQVIMGPKTGLPIPAHAEIAFEGFIHPNDKIDEGPLGEWTGYYAGGLKKEPAIRVETMMYRDDPILLGAIPGIPPDDNSFYRGSYRSGAVWNQLEAAGVPEVKGVWSHAAGGSRLWLTVAIKQHVRRPFQAGRPDRLAMPRRRLCEPLRRGGGRRHRSGRHGQGDLGDVHALRSARGHGDSARLLVVGARPDGLWRQTTRATPASSSTPASRSAARDTFPIVVRAEPGGRGSGARQVRRTCCRSGSDCRNDRKVDITLNINGRDHADPRRAAQDAGRRHPRRLRARPARTSAASTASAAPAR